MGIAHDGGLGDLLMGDERALDLRRAHAMARDIDHIIDAAGDPVIPVVIAPAAVAGEVAPGIGCEISVEEALMVAIDRAHLARPGIGDTEIALGLTLQLASAAI